MAHDALIDRLVNEVIPASFDAMPGYRVWQATPEKQAYRMGYIAALRHMVQILERIRMEDVH